MFCCVFLCELRGPAWAEGSYSIGPQARECPKNINKISPMSSGQPKGLSFGFRPKVSVLASAELFRQKLTFWQKCTILAESRKATKRAERDRKRVFRPKEGYFVRKKVILAEIPSFGLFRLFRLLSAFGRNCTFLNPLFRFRPKLFPLTTTNEWMNNGVCMR